MSALPKRSFRLVRSDALAVEVETEEKRHAPHDLAIGELILRRGCRCG